MLTVILLTLVHADINTAETHIADKIYVLTQYC
jgi:hypothetical protein